jgi:uncharacterized membrane protein YgcG
MYQCIKTFTASNGRQYVKDQAVSVYGYRELSSLEQRNFVIMPERRSDDDDDSGIGSIIDTAVAVSSLFNTFSSGDSGDGSSSSDTFGGFDGGDSGGAGASGDW